MTQGAPSEDMFNEIPARIEFMFKRHGFEDAAIIRGCGLSSIAETEVPEDIMGLAEETAEKMMNE